MASKGFKVFRISSAACHISEEGLSTETAQPEADEKPKEVEVVIIPCGWIVNSDTQGSPPKGCMVMWSNIMTWNVSANPPSFLAELVLSQRWFWWFLWGVGLVPQAIVRVPQHRTWKIQIPFDESMSVSFYQNGLVPTDFSMWVFPSRAWGQRCKKNTENTPPSGRTGMDLFSTAGFSTLISWLTLGDVSTVGTLPHKPSNSTGHWASVFFSYQNTRFLERLQCPWQGLKHVL